MPRHEGKGVWSCDVGGPHPLVQDTGRVAHASHSSSRNCLLLPLPLSSPPKPLLLLLPPRGTGPYVSFANCGLPYHGEGGGQPVAWWCVVWVCVWGGGGGGGCFPAMVRGGGSEPGGEAGQYRTKPNKNMKINCPPTRAVGNVIPQESSLLVANAAKFKNWWVQWGGWVGGLCGSVRGRVGWGGGLCEPPV